MTAQHTPGPWTFDAESDKRHKQFAIMAGTGGLDGEGGKVAAVFAGFGAHFDWAESEANARLIAAAPELLAALKTLVELGTDSPEHQAAERAIAKAEAR